MATHLQGIIPAHILPFDANDEIDEKSLRHHVRSLADTPGVTGITTVAHASEVASLSDAEQLRLLEIVLDEVSGALPIVAGVYDTDNRSAKRKAQALAKAGADALLIFPCSTWDMGHQMRPEIAYSYYADIASVTELPMVAFVYPVSSGLHITTDSLIQICSEIPNVSAVKEWSNDIVTYERNYREIKTVDKSLSVLSSYSKALLPSLVIGADGILSGHGSMLASYHAQLFSAVGQGDLISARNISDKIFYSTEQIYKDPFVDGHNRMKTCLHLLGQIDTPNARSPLMPLTERERDDLKQSLIAAGLETGIVR